MALLGGTVALSVALPFSGALAAEALTWPLAAWGGGAMTALVASRAAIGFAFRRLKHSPRFARRVAVAGDKGRIRTVLQILEQRPQTKIAAILCDEPMSPAPEGAVLARWADIEAVMQPGHIDDVIVALPWTDERRVAAYMGKLREFPVDVHLFPDNIHPFLSARGVSLLRGVPMARLAVRPLSTASRVAKAVEDKVVASLALLIAAPILAACAVAIRLDSPGPVLFRQKRYGYNNQVFTVFKFRTMHVQSGAVIQARRNDPRVTRVGRFLRRTSLDELPQLFNVLNGTMSVVGPRPHAVEHQTYYQHIVDQYRSRHRMKPGITGLAQIKGYRGETQTLELMRKRVEYDIAYIENWSILLDLWIIAATPFACLRGNNAY
jgi:putative colanic acid biosynthesis UDP-glucose lipid carrier transferase